MNEYLRVFTESRNSYIVKVKGGFITQYDPWKAPESHQFSGRWIFVGLSHVKMNWVLRLSQIQDNPKILDEIHLLYKNGKGQFTVRDLDHGTTREWGDRVISIGFINRTKENK